MQVFLQGALTPSLQMVSTAGMLLLQSHPCLWQLLPVSHTIHQLHHQQILLCVSTCGAHTNSIPHSIA